MEENKPDLHFEVSVIQDKSKLIPSLRWEDSSYSSGSPLRIRNEIKIVEIDEEESDQEYIEYSAKKNKRLFEAVMDKDLKQFQDGNLSLPVLSPEVSPTNSPKRYRPLGFGRASRVPEMSP